MGEEAWNLPVRGAGMKFSEALIPTRAMPHAIPVLRREFKAALGDTPDNYDWQFIPEGAALLEEPAQPLFATQDYVRIFAYRGKR